MCILKMNQGIFLIIPIPLIKTHQVNKALSYLVYSCLIKC